ncbi:MAG: hypothetical protein AAF603_02165 [Pseudomonadota bacterium]
MTKIDAVKATELPSAWRKKLELADHDLVQVTLEKMTDIQSIDISAVKEIIERVQKLPVLDNRTADEIIGYDKDGLIS